MIPACAVPTWTSIPLDGTCHVLVAMTGPDGVTVTVRLWMPEAEREDWRTMLGILRG